MASETFFVKNSFYIRKFVLTLNKDLPLSKNQSVIDVRVWGECMLALILLLGALPLLLLIGIMIKWSSPGPVLYQQERIGLNGHVFKIIKLRSMHENAEAETGPVLSDEKDPRVTSIGRFLRESHLDELPQLFNIIKGEMSFFGPRPERPKFVEQNLDTVELYHLRHTQRPGLTGLAQVCLPYNATAKDKIDYDLSYIRYRNSIRLHAAIVYLTLKKIFVIKSSQSKIAVTL